MNDETIPLFTGRRESGDARSRGQSEIGFVGLGHMGTAMAANLIAAGHRVIAYVRRPDQMERLAALGIEPTTKFTDLFDREVVVSMLPDDGAVRDVVLGQEGAGAEGLASGLKRGAIHLSMSTISTAAAAHLAAEHARHGQGYVAAPVFGNPDAAKARQLFIVAAGAPADVERSPWVTAGSRPRFAQAAQLTQVEVAGGLSRWHDRPLDGLPFA